MKKYRKSSYTLAQKKILNILKKNLKTFMPEKEFSDDDAIFSKILEVATNESAEWSMENFQPWISILDQGIATLYAMELALIKPKNSRSYSTLVSSILSGMTCSQAVSIRSAILFGFDNSSKIIFRSLLETLDMLVVAFCDEEFARGYHSCETDEENGEQALKKVRQFWESEIAFGKIAKKMDQILKNFGEGEIEIYRSWRKELNAHLNQSVHPSFTQAAFTILTPTAKSRSLRFARGSLGHPNLHSIGTLEQVIEAIHFHVGIIINLIIKNKYDYLDVNNEKHLIFLLRGMVFQELVFGDLKQT